MYLKLKAEDCSEDKGENDGTIDECAQRYQEKTCGRIQVVQGQNPLEGCYTKEVSEKEGTS